MKTHFYIVRDKVGEYKNKLYVLSEKPKYDTGEWIVGDYGKFGSIDRDCFFYKKLRPILSKIDPGKCIKVACDLKVVK